MIKWLQIKLQHWLGTDVLYAVVVAQNDEITKIKAELARLSVERYVPPSTPEEP